MSAAGYTTREIQQELLCLMTWFHELCRSNGINYSLHGGTLLGAIRERGFIPWDDDADISMMRVEYEKLSSLLKNREDKIKFDDYSDRLPRIMMHREGKPLVWIDIFIYDYISELEAVQRIKLLFITFLIMFSKSRKLMRLVKVSGNCTGWKYWCYNSISLFGMIFPLKYRIQLTHWFCKNCFTGKKKYIHRSLDQHCAIGLILPAEVMAEYDLISFEDKTMMISTKYHEILVSSYGSDYMTPKRTDSQTHETAREEYVQL